MRHNLLLYSYLLFAFMAGCSRPMKSEFTNHGVFLRLDNSPFVKNTTLFLRWHSEKDWFFLDSLGHPMSLDAMAVLACKPDSELLIQLDASRPEVVSAIASISSAIEAQRPKMPVVISIRLINLPPPLQN